MPDVNTPYSLVLLDEYANTLDALPIELSRNFADLRELDAVLSASIVQITSKIHNLTTMIEEGTASKQDKLWVLSEIAEEAQRLKLGGEDKIRVACQAADNLKSHSGHLRALTENLPGFDLNTLNRNTVYPHVSERSYMPAGLTEGGRRRRNGFTSLLVANQADPSPAKRKRALPKDDDVENSQRSPKKPAHGDSHQRNRNTARVKKTDRAASPSESLVSVTSHLPQPAAHATTGRSGNTTSHRNTNSTATANKRRAANNNNNRNSTPLVNESHAAHSAAHTNGSRRGAAAEAYNVPPSTSHPSLPLPYQNGSANGHQGYDIQGLGQDWIPPAQQLEGPGMPVARSASIHSTAASATVAANAADTNNAGDTNDEGDDRTYCICDGVSYGEMIACDDNSCEREWFHLTCINLTAPPAGQWYCDSCKAKKNQKRNQRGGKRKAASRANGKS